MVTFLTSEFCLEEALGALRVAFACCQLPTGRTLNALIPTRTTACITAQITFNAAATIAVIAGNDKVHNENDNSVVESLVADGR